MKWKIVTYSFKLSSSCNAVSTVQQAGKSADLSLMFDSIILERSWYVLHAIQRSLQLLLYTIAFSFSLWSVSLRFFQNVPVVLFTTLLQKMDEGIIRNTRSTSIPNYSNWNFLNFYIYSSHTPMTSYYLDQFSFTTFVLLNTLITI